MPSPKLLVERVASAIASKCSSRLSVPSPRPIAGSSLISPIPRHSAKSSCVVTRIRGCSKSPCGKPAFSRSADTRIPDSFNLGNRRPGTRKCLLIELCFTFQRGHIDHEAIFYVGLQEPVIGVVDLLDGDDFDVGGDVVFAAEVEHLLSFGDASDRRAGETAAAEEK